MRVVVATALVVLAAGAAFADPIALNTEMVTDSGFETGTAGNSFNVPVTNPFNAATGPYGVWIDVNQWKYQLGGSGGGSLYAGHVTGTSNNTNILFQGIDTRMGLGGTELTFSMDYRFDGGTDSRRVFVLGLTNENVSRFPNSFPSNNLFLPPGAILLDLDKTDLPITTGTWGSLTRSITIIDPNAYNSILIAVIYSSGTNATAQVAVRGVDNVSLQITGGAIPEPGALLLFAAAGAAAMLRRRRR